MFGASQRERPLADVRVRVERVLVHSEPARRPELGAELVPQAPFADANDVRRENAERVRRETGCGFLAAAVLVLAMGVVLRVVVEMDQGRDDSPVELVADAGVENQEVREPDGVQPVLELARVATPHGGLRGAEHSVYVGVEKRRKHNMKLKLTRNGYAVSKPCLDDIRSRFTVRPGKNYTVTANPHDAELAPVPPTSPRRKSRWTGNRGLFSE